MQDHELIAYFKRGFIPGPHESEEDFTTRVSQAPHLPPWEENLFGFAIDWVPITYTTKGLAFWEGAATLMRERSISVQLRPAFQKGPFLGYRPSDILAHEAVHAARICFEEPKFEEMLAYQTAPERWKRWFGPVFQRSWEPWVLFFSLLLGLYEPCIPLALMKGGLLRLLRRHWQLRRCLRRFPLPAVICMTDAEIMSGKIKENGTLRARLVRLLKN